MPVIEPAGTITFNTTITTGAATRLPNTPARSVVLHAKAANTAVIWIGGSDVTTGGGGSVLFDLAAGSTVILDIANANLLYSASAASQTLYVTGLL